MPTKTSNESPLYQTTEEQKELRKGTLGGAAAGAAIGAKIGSFIPIPGIGTLAGAGVGALAGGLIGRNKAKKETEEEIPQTTYVQTNINPFTGQEYSIQDYNKVTPLSMTGKPLKMLTGIKGNIPHNMSAAQYKSSLKMQEISGAAPLQANAFYASLNAAKEEGRDTFEVGGKKFNVK
tara:strand:+ start:150 stop:683 length:534 start_codon:yes stop_codon:yes gene_type:complete